MRTILFIFAFFLFPSVSGASQSSVVRQGNQLYQQEKYPDALGKYHSALDKDPDSFIINFNTAAALYKNGDYEKAIPHFQKSLLSDDKFLQQKVHYNLGNSFYKAGLTKEKSDLKSAARSLEQSLSHYEKSLELNKEDADAQFNRELVAKELQRLREKEKTQKNNQDQQKKDSAQNQDPNQNKSDEKKENPASSQPAPSSQSQPGEADQKKPDAANPAEKKPDEKKNQAAGPSDQKKGEEPAPAANETSSSEKKKELTPKEAQMLLDNYDQNEEPKGLLNMRLRGPKEHSVLKDW